MALDRTQTDLIVVHGTTIDTPEELHRLAMNSGIRSTRGRTGFHFMITPDGYIAKGRAIDEVGAHARGYNDRSVGIILLGRTPMGYGEDQLAQLNTCILLIMQHYQHQRLTIVGHDDFSSTKCPGFDVSEWAFNQGFV